jgi:hypothetical protein
LESTLNTTTIITYLSNGSVSIVCQYISDDQDDLPNVIFADVADTDVTFNGKLISQGDLYFFLKNSPFDINAQIDDNGHLLLLINTGDDSNYFIDDSTGMLKYNKS